MFILSRPVNWTRWLYLIVTRYISRVAGPIAQMPYGFRDFYGFVFRFRLRFVVVRHICGRDIADSRSIEFVIQFALLDKQQTSSVTMCGSAGSGVGLVDGTLGRTFF